mmetsp:Transcript_38238/g.96882  ORF Transcript_38238/g.96882 Transcript_38238/m.96882 type:complete len:242 (+) Transcript_38238:153-878(+)
MLSNLVQHTTAKSPDARQPPAHAPGRGHRPRAAFWAPCTFGFITGATVQGCAEYCHAPRIGRLAKCRTYWRSVRLLSVDIVAKCTAAHLMGGWALWQGVQVHPWAAEFCGAVYLHWRDAHTDDPRPRHQHSFAATPKRGGNIMMSQHPEARSIVVQGGGTSKVGRQTGIPREDYLQKTKKCTVVTYLYIVSTVSGRGQYCVKYCAARRRHEAMHPPQTITHPPECGYDPQSRPKLMPCGQS